MSYNPLVTIVIPTYQRSVFLKRSITSCLNQTHKNLEIIVIDNNPRDSTHAEKTTRILDELLDSRIVPVKMNENIGAVAARNYGLSIAKGEYINFLDDDDELLPNKISSQLEIFLQSKKKLGVVGGFANIYNDTKKIREEKTRIRGNVYLNHLKSNMFTTSIGLFKTDIIRSIGGFKNIPSSQEYILLLELFSINPYYDYVDECVVNIHQHKGDRISKSKNKPIGAIEAWELVKKRIVDLNVKDQKEIKYHHLYNIGLSYINVSDRKNSLKYLMEMIREFGVFKSGVAKLLLMNIMGIRLYVTMLSIFKRG